MAVARKELEKMQAEVLKTQQGAPVEAVPSSMTPEGGWLAYPEPGIFQRAIEHVISTSARVAWPTFQFFNKYRQGKPFQPKWAPAPLLKSHEKTKPPLGWPRETDSLCPRCVKEVREEIIAGDRDYTELIEGNPGEIKSQIIERDGEVWMVKDCPKHGHFEDIMAMDVDFLENIERRYPGRDFKSPETLLRNHGSSSVKYGRGSVLTVDLTNRCNMMCDPCFMDANQVGYVHELSWEEIQEILDNSLKIKPRRQMSVQFSGGEPTLSPHFLKAVKYCKDIGYFSIQAATNGIRFAQDPEYAEKAYEAGMRIAYLQFDGVSNESNAHRKISNLFDVKLRAITNLAKAGIDVVLVTTIVNTINNDQVGKIVEFAVQNSDKITFCAFQPVSFTGRDEDISDEDRRKQRYTLSHLAHDVKNQTGISEPLRDWFPISAAAPFSDLADMMKGPEADWGTLKCGCHPNCGTIMGLLVNKETKEWWPLSEFLDLEQLLNDMGTITDANRGEALTKAQVAMSLLRNYNPSKAPKGFGLRELLRKFDKQSGGGLGGGDYGEGKERKRDKWHFMFVAGMWFQDLFNYDFRRTEMCIIPYATQIGEISFCAYNTGVGWRQIIENMFKNADVGEWYKKHGRHGVYAGNRAMPVPEHKPEIALPQDDDVPDDGGLPTYRSQVVLPS